MAFERLTINLQSGVLADSYQIDQLFDEPIGTAHSGTIYGWPLGCTVRGKSYNPKTGRYSLTGDYDISEKLKKYIDLRTKTDASAVMTTAAAQLGKTAVINIDNHGIKAMTQATTVMQALSSLFSWTAGVPHRFVNVFQRGAVIHVLQRGKEASSYELVSYDIKSLRYRLTDTLMDEMPNYSPVIIGDPPDGDPGEPGSSLYTGTFAFGASSVTYLNGLCTRVVTDSSDGQTVIQNAYTDGLLRSVITTFYGNDPENNTESLSLYTYAEYDGIPYTSKNYEETSAVVQGGYFRVMRATETTFHPLGLEKYGASVTDYTAQYNSDGYYTGLSRTASRTYVAEGRPGGKASPWSITIAPVASAAMVRSVSISRNPLGDINIPVTDLETIQRYAAGLEWLDGKTETILQVDCFDEHIVDFDKTVSVMGQTWYLQSNQITIGPGAKAKQSLELVRWG